uniref:Uncharacterized protein n=1 Tax=Timema poppense TaxID=170557 RepID=A0A7R9DDU5_TIMPO|nr:unnamed protein product [Timema poppensis]
MLIADALRLGGAILSVYPDMLASQLIGRLLPEIGPNRNVKMLLKECDQTGPDHNALLPLYHCLHTPGGPLKYSLEGHQFAVFGFCLTSDYRYIVSISNKFITWDLSTSDLTRDVNPAIEGIMQQLVLSPDNRFAAAYTNNNQTILLNTLTSEYVTVENPLPTGEYVSGVFLLNAHLFVHGQGTCCRFNMRGQLEDQFSSVENPNEWPYHSMHYTTMEEYWLLFWSGSLDKHNMRLRSILPTGPFSPLDFHSAMVMTRDRSIIYCCTQPDRYGVTKYCAYPKEARWLEEKTLPAAENDDVEVLLQLKLDKDETTLIGTTGNGFVLWDFSEESTREDALVFPLPHGVRNISTRLIQSNSCMVSAARDYAVAGVRKNLYVWSMANGALVKVLDAHFGRIISLEPLTIGNWNSVSHWN